MQKLLWLSTSINRIRADVEGWGWEGGADYVHQAYEERRGTKYHYNHPNDVPIGLVKSWPDLYPWPHYPTVVHAMADGWRVMSPPEKNVQTIEGKEVITYEWWLTKD